MGVRNDVHTSLGTIYAYQLYCRYVHGNGLIILIPGVEISVGENHLRLWVCRNELLREQYSGNVGHALAVTQQFVELGATIRFAFAIEFRFDSLHPHLIVPRILKERLPAVVTFIDAQQAERGACCCRRD